MLVLSRKNQESVIIGAEEGLGSTVKVTVVEIGSGSVRLGFEAKKTVAVHREEVWERIRANGGPAPPKDGPATLKEQLDRWEDDGGGPKTPDDGPRGAPRDGNCQIFRSTRRRQKGDHKNVETTAPVLCICPER